MLDIQQNNQELDLLNYTLRYDKLKRRPLVNNLGTVTLNSSGTATVAHGLSKIPNVISWIPHANIVLYLTANSDATNIYIKGLYTDNTTANGVTVDIVVMYFDNNIN